MGIIKASVSAIRSTAADQWKEAFRAREMGNDLLMTHAQKLTSERSGNEGNKGVITDGSIIIVGEGECAVATEGGKIIGVYDQPGEHVFKSNQSSGIFGGGLGAFAKDVGRRISFGGEVAITQRLYYINTKELFGGTIHAEGIPLRFKDPRAELDIDGGISCYGCYSFRITKPELFYKATIRSTDMRSRMELLQQMDNEVLTAMAPALTQLTKDGIRPNELLQHTTELCQKLRQVMSNQWSGLRGIEVVSVALESVSVLDAATFRTMQRDVAFQDPRRAAAHIIGAKADAMQAAAANEGGAPAFVVATSGNLSVENDRWICKCNSENKGNFCTECGAKKPANIPQDQCTHCGWKPEDKMHPPKFCPECGNPFNCQTN